MNITQVFLKKVISEVDSDIWGQLRPYYLPTEYQSLYKVINKYFEDNSRLPSFDALKLSIRSDLLLNKVYAVEASEDCDLTSAELLEYIKNQYTQEEILVEIENYLDESIMIDSAQENLNRLQGIITHIEDRVDLKDPEEDMSRIDLFDTEDEISKMFRLGLNTDYDNLMQFGCTDYILFGGRRGAGKSLTCSNIAVTSYENNRSSIYFTIEMTSRSILQRNCAIATGISPMLLKSRNLTMEQWHKVAKWWASRFEDSGEAYKNYIRHNSFDTLHSDLIKLPLRADAQMEVIHDPELTLSTIRGELDKKVEKLNPAVIIVDYVNQVSRFNSHKVAGQYDWTEQIEVSKALKAIAQEYKIPVISPYQMDANGEARFSKGILDSADAAFTLNPYDKKDNCLTFDCVKMRGFDEVSFTSYMNWDSLKIGPTSVLPPTAQKPEKSEKSNSVASDEAPFDL